MIKEREKYTIRLTDAEYRKVIENAQMDTSNGRAIAIKFATMQQQINEKDKRIQELEKEKQRYKIAFNQQVEVLKDTVKKLNDSIPTQVVIDTIEELKKEYDEEYDIYMGFKVISRKQHNLSEQIELLQKILEGGKKK